MRSTRTMYHNVHRHSSVLRRFLGPDLNRRSVRHRAPDLVDLVVGNSDAAVGPVLQSMSRAHISIAIGQSVNKDITPGRRALLASLRPVALTGIRNVNRLVELAVGVAKI